MNKIKDNNSIVVNESHFDSVFDEKQNLVENLNKVDQKVSNAITHNGAFIGVAGKFKYNKNVSKTPVPQRRKFDPSISENQPKFGGGPGIDIGNFADDPPQQFVVEKNRKKYLQSLGLVPKGQERILQYIKRP